VPHDFLKTVGGERVEAERFETLRPDATVCLRLPGDERLDVLVERDDRAGQPGWTAKLERYDHFLAGWSAHTSRYSSGAAAVVVFLCRDRPRAREAARRADHVLRACRAYAGDYPQTWDYLGRAVAFACERDVHEGELLAWRAPALPPDVRASLSGDEPSAAEGRAVRVSLPAPAP
jgi:hypothetical protein